jgi:phage-related minor tail protein
VASKALKGLTIKIGGDTSELLDSLKDVEKRGAALSRELGEIDRLLKLDPGNVDLLAQRQKVLSDAVGTTREKLDKLKEAEREAQEQFARGEISEEQYRALQREIVKTEKKLEGYEHELDDTNKKLDQHGKKSKKTGKDVDDLADASKKAEKSSEGLGGALANAAKVGLTAVGAAVGAVVGGLTAAAESTREYRTEMGKLDTAFTQNGFTADAAYGAYSELQGVLGETDQAVEAANHLAQLTNNEKELAKWTGDILPGVYATFGASLPIEGLTEAANETAKVGQVTGPLADALTWAGVSEEKFNKQLEACSNEQERQALITKTLTNLYGDASKAYKETNEEVIRANKANEEWTQSLAGVGEAVEPIITDVKMMGASLLSEALPGIEALSEAFRGILNGDEGATDAMGEALSGILTDLVNKVAELLPQVVEMAVSLVASLLPQLISMLADLTPKLLTVIVEQLPVILEALISGLSQILASIGEMLPQVLPLIMDALLMVVEVLIDNVDLLIDAAIVLVLGLADGLIEAVPRLLEKVPVIINKLVAAVTENLPKLIAAGIELVVKLGAGLIVAIPKLLANIPLIISAIVGGLKDGITSVGDIGGDLVEGLWNGIKDMTGWITDKLSGFGDTVLSGIKDFFGIASPSKVLAKEVGRFLPAGLAQGVTDNADEALNAMSDLTGDMLDEAEQMNGVTLERRLHNTFDPVPAAESMSFGLFDKLDRILAAIEQGQILTIDGDTLVGATSNRMDSALGRRRALAARGAI